MIIEKVQEQRRILHFFQLQEAGSGSRLSGCEDIFAGNAGDLFRDAAQMIHAEAYTIAAMGGDVFPGTQPREIGAASGPQRDHRSARKACPIDRSRRRSQPTSSPGTSSQRPDAPPCRRAAGPTRARTKEGATGRAGGARNKDTTTSKGGGQAHTRPGSTRNRESSHTGSSTRRAGPGAASRSQTHRDASKRTNKGSRHTASRSTTDRRTRAPTITTGRETHTPTDRESTTATAGSPQREDATAAPGLRVGAPSTTGRSWKTTDQGTRH